MDKASNFVSHMLHYWQKIEGMEDQSSRQPLFQQMWCWIHHLLLGFPDGTVFPNLSWWRLWNWHWCVGVRSCHDNQKSSGNGPRRKAVGCQDCCKETCCCARKPGLQPTGSLLCRIQRATTRLLPQLSFHSPELKTFGEHCIGAIPLKYETHCQLFAKVGWMWKSPNGVGINSQSTGKYSKTGTTKKNM